MDTDGVDMEYELLDENAQPESKLGYAARTGARSIARGLESLAGLPGDISSGILGLANLGINKVTGKESPLPSKIPYLPTSESVREKVTKPLTGDYLEPRDEAEKFYDEIAGDAATLFIPVKGKVPFVKYLGSAISKSALANTAKWAAEYVSDSPLLGEGAKIGSLVIANTLGGRSQLRNLQNNSYTDAFSQIKGKSFNFSPERKKLDKLIDSIKSRDTQNKQFLLDRFQSLDYILTSKKSNIESVIHRKQDWNKYLRSDIPKETSKVLKEGIDILTEGINRYGSKNPEFFRPYMVGEELTQAIKGSNYLMDLIKNSPYLEKSAKNPVVKTLMGIGAYHGLHSLTPGRIALGAGTYIGTNEAAKAYQLLSKSPIARKYYKDAIESGFKGNTKLMGRNLSRLDKVADKFKFEDVDGDYELID